MPYLAGDGPDEIEAFASTPEGQQLNRRVDPYVAADREAVAAAALGIVLRPFRR